MAIYRAYIDDGSFLFLPMRDVEDGHIIVPRGRVLQVDRFQDYSFKLGRRLCGAERLGRAQSADADILAEFSSKRLKIDKRWHFLPFYKGGTRSEFTQSNSVEREIFNYCQQEQMQRVSACRGLAGISVAFKVDGFPEFLQSLQEKARLLEP